MLIVWRLRSNPICCMQPILLLWVHGKVLLYQNLFFSNAVQLMNWRIWQLTQNDATHFLTVYELEIGHSPSHSSGAEYRYYTHTAQQRNSFVFSSLRGSKIWHTWSYYHMQHNANPHSTHTAVWSCPILFIFSSYR